MSSGSTGRCSEAVEGVHEDCCLHDLRRGDKYFPGQVCCWCGLIFLARETWWTSDHGEYEPALPKTVLKRREAAGRKETRLREKALKENER